MCPRAFKTVPDILLMAVLALSARSVLALEPANPKANAKARAILNYFVELDGRAEKRVLSGQFTDCGTNASLKLPREIYEKTGHFPALVGADYADFRTGGLHTQTVNRLAMEYWRMGGLVTISAHLYNPARAGKGGLRDKGVDLEQLIMPGTEVNARWMEELDTLAAGLGELKDASVVVLWRPFHEMNGDWFWWGGAEPSVFIKLWRHMFDYFSTTKNLDNLLWVYGPNHGSKTAEYYAGDAYVDLIGLDAYTDNVAKESIRGYDEIAKTGKPFGFTEFGPHGSSNPPGDYDYRRFIEGVTKNFPRTTFFLCWSAKWSISRNNFGKELLEHRWVANLEDLPVALAGKSSQGGAAANASRVILNETEYRDKVYACWLGKSIGGTLGMPVEGRQEMHDFSFYTPVPTTPAPNDDLDLQLLWVKAAEEHGARVDAHVLGELWLRYVCVDWNEYGVGRANMRDGFPPPLSGQFRNEKWRDSNGAWIRSETWACLLPGCPSIAARYAWEDACVDHGTAEGTLAELFTAAIQSAAFVESDRGRLMEIGLAYLPPGSAVAVAVRAAVDARRQGLDLKAARERTVQVTKPTGWFMAPRNVAFVVLGVLYGDGDFGKSICATVNCGDDTDSTGATVGALMGILLGSKGISPEWRKPVGEGIQNVAIHGFESPRMIGEFSDQTVRVAKAFLKDAGARVEIRPDAPTDLGAVRELALVDPTTAAKLWARSPWQVTNEFEGVHAVLDFQSEPRIEAATPRLLKLSLENLAEEPVEVIVVWKAEPGLTCDHDRDGVKLEPRGGSPSTLEASFTVPEIRTRILRGSVEIVRGGKTVGGIPFAFFGGMTVSRGDLARARLGAKATSDSELDREPGCTARAIDGDIEGENDFGGRRWHSALTPHPHWIAVELPAPRKIGRVVIHAADPAGYPVDFDGEASLDGNTWTTVFRVEGSTESRTIEKAFPAVELRHFKLTIRRSANPKFPNAAQVSEIELLER